MTILFFLVCLAQQLLVSSQFLYCFFEGVQIPFTAKPPNLLQADQKLAKKNIDF
jgi:hypothetical protein